jgi:hypothetical protein|tara:strand:- start:232 stop:378 length:147 start_codon:yes stop_codon:yes gene_type:complete
MAQARRLTPAAMRPNETTNQPEAGVGGLGATIGFTIHALIVELWFFAS